MTDKNVTKFYDDFVEQQQNTGINERLYGLFKRMKKLGIKSDSNVLEFGCGIGAMTYLLSKKVKRGKIEAVDISPASINFASQRLKQANITFRIHDVVNYIPALKNIDFIILFDILEHIPPERHVELFRHLHSIAADHTTILLNIPNPVYAEYDRRNAPELVQIIDQSIPFNFMVHNLTESNLELVFFETYSIWVENDYQFFVIRKKSDFHEIKLSNKRNSVEKALNKVERMWARFIFKYP